MNLITDAAYYPALFVIDHLRAIDREEIAAVKGENFSHMALALEINSIGNAGFAYMTWGSKLNDEPIAVWGVYPLTPSSVAAFAFATDRWGEVMRPVTRHIRKTMIPRLLAQGHHRAECRSLATRQDTRRWLTGMGWKPEAVLSNFGVHREDFVLYAWTTSDGAYHPVQRHRQDQLPLRDTRRSRSADGALRAFLR